MDFFGSVVRDDMSIAKTVRESEVLRELRALDGGGVSGFGLRIGGIGGSSEEFTMAFSRTVVDFPLSHLVIERTCRELD